MLSISTLPEHELSKRTAAGEAANRAAVRSVFADYQKRKAANTNRRHAADLARFATYLADMGLQPSNLGDDPQAWEGITWGIVAGFARWQEAKGYAISSINMALSTVRVYATMAAGYLESADHVMIKTVKGYSRKEGKRVNDLREANAIPTRTGDKKAAAVKLTPQQAAQLKAQPGDTPQGRRDALLMCLLLDHGLRIGEVVRLAVGDFDLTKGMLFFYRPKVDRLQTHKLTPETLAAARAYFEHDAPALGCVWRASASKKDGKQARGTLGAQGATERGYTKRVATLGAALGIDGLSAHDCRHYWATQAADMGTPLDRLQQAGGWNSYAMPLRYIKAAEIANKGVKLD